MKFWQILIVFLLFSIFYPVEAGHYCTIVSGNEPCPSSPDPTNPDNTITQHFVYLGYGFTNTHINYTLGASADIADNYKQCCNFIPERKQIPADEDCLGDHGYTATLFDMYQDNNSHVAPPGTLGDSTNYKVCGNNSVNKLTCEYQEGSRATTSQQSPLIYLRQISNSHAELANLSSIGESDDPEYDNMVYCTLTPISPLLVSVTAVSRSVLNATLEDKSGNEYEFEYYGADHTGPINTDKFGENRSTSMTSTGTRYSHLYSGLHPNTTYYVRARANDTDGSFSEYSNEIKRSTHAAIPLNVRVQNINDTALEILWDRNDNPTNTVYTVYWGFRNDTNEINSGPVCQTTNNRCIDDNLTPHEEYCYAVHAMNSEFVNTSYSAPNCGQTSFTPVYDLDTWFDPNTMSVPQEGFVKTYVFINNTANVPDRFDISFPGYDNTRIRIVPETATIDISANSTDRVEFTIFADSVQTEYQFNVRVESVNDETKVGQDTFTLRQIDVVGVPGLTSLGIVILAILGSLVLLI